MEVSLPIAHRVSWRYGTTLEQESAPGIYLLGLMPVARRAQLLPNSRRPASTRPIRMPRPDRNRLRCGGRLRIDARSSLVPPRPLPRDVARARLSTARTSASIRIETTFAVILPVRSCPQFQSQKARSRANRPGLICWMRPEQAHPQYRAAWRNSFQREKCAPCAFGGRWGIRSVTRRWAFRPASGETPDRRATAPAGTRRPPARSKHVT